uniref:Uncharacterized protein n=1 Tax=Phaselicystis flava TaxID=525924 RepID=A0A3S5GYF9_9BACT|nr:hypothetical protein [Phaselicystis flava]
MLKTLAYHLEDDAYATARIGAIRAGTSHLALANGLVALAEMYREHWGALKDDPKNFRPTDPDEAAKLSEQMLRLLGVSPSPEQASWKAYCAKCAKLLFQHYEEAIRVGRFLWYYDGAEERFPSLHSVTRAAPAPRKKNGTAEPEKAGNAEG